MKQDQFLDVLNKDEALRRFLDAIPADTSLGTETVALEEARGRVLAKDVVSSADVPGFDRANMDGYALRASDTYGASEATPLCLRRSASSVAIGHLAPDELLAGQAMAIPTGGAIPRGADAVLMIEATEVHEDGRVEIRRSITPGTAMSYAGTDIAQGETVLHAGTRLTSRETGVLAAIGQHEILVRRRPVVAIISTGNEIVAPGTVLSPGKIYDSNAIILADAVRECGGVPRSFGIVDDDTEALAARLREALAQSDIVLLSGGTSKGPGDLNAKVLARVLAPPGIIAHGVALKPGKPLCLAMSGEKPVVVLPGFPTSAIFTFHEFVAPMLRLLAGWIDEPHTGSVRATLSRRFQSVIGRRQYVMTHLIDTAASQPIAYPIDKGSGSVTTWSQADGYFAISEQVEHINKGKTVDVFPIAGARARRCDLVIIGSHCVGLDLLVALMRQRGFSSKLVTVGSRAGLAAAKDGLCDVAGIHLLDMQSGQYNHPFGDETVEIVSGYGRMQGLVYRRGDARFSEEEEKDLPLAVAAAIRGGKITMINRNRGSGTRLLIDALLAGATPRGYSIEATSHQAVATAIAQGRADFGVAIDIVAKERGLAFRPLREERFDFVMPRGRRSRPAVAAFCELLSDDRTRAALTLRGFTP